jgi:hypothetical protein
MRREQALDKLSRVQAHFTSLLAANCSPTLELDNSLDLAILKAVALAENARKPGLNLRVFDLFAEFGQALKSGSRIPFRAVIPLPYDAAHRLAVDVAFPRGRPSIIAVESLGIEGLTEHFNLHQLGIMAEIPASARMTMIASNAQQSQADCAIFSVSAALKMHFHANEFSAMHQQQSGGLPIGKSALAQDDDISDGRIDLVDGTPLLPADFVKHAQSRTRLTNWVELHGARNQPASSSRHGGPTLLQRHDALRVTRFSEDGALGMSVSIERKRLELLKRAINHLRHAPDRDVREVLQGFEHHVPDLDEQLQNAAPRVMGQISRASMYRA